MAIACMSPPHKRPASFRRKGRLQPQAELCPGIYNPRGRRQGREPASADVCLARAELVSCVSPHQPFAPKGSPAKPVRFRPPHAGRTAACLLPSRHTPALASGRSPVPACDPSRIRASHPGPNEWLKRESSPFVSSEVETLRPTLACLDFARHERMLAQIKRMLLQAQSLRPALPALAWGGDHPRDCGRKRAVSEQEKGANCSAPFP